MWQVMEHQDDPLRVEVTDGGELVIRIGIERLADCFERMDENNPWSDELRDFKKIAEVVDYKEFADDVRSALCVEREDGSTILTDLLDKATMAAFDDGSLGCKHVGESE